MSDKYDGQTIETLKEIAVNLKLAASKLEEAVERLAPTEKK